MKIQEYHNKDTSYTIVNAKKPNSLSSLKKVNIFVGANNAGKSRFLRQIFNSGADNFGFLNDPHEKLKTIYENLFLQFKEVFYMKGLKELMKSKWDDFEAQFNAFYDKIYSITKRKEGLPIDGNITIWDFDVAEALRNEFQKYKMDKETISQFDVKRRHIYIPILRGLRHLDFENDLSNKTDVYKLRTSTDYGVAINVNPNGEIFSGLSVYGEIKRMLLGSKDDRKFIREFENFLSESFFENKSITLIPDHDTDTLRINIDGHDDREIFNVGDGIQSIIINTFQAFKCQKEEVLLCIEEPEMMMHPSVQRVLIETLTTKFDNIQIFLTTHSNHFLDLTYDYPNDVSIFSFQEVNTGEFQIKNVDDHSKILDLLGVRNSSVFLANSVIWTEGVTDRMLLRKLLELKKVDYKEDYHYSFAEYGGSNLENFDFIDEDNSHNVSVQSLTKTNYIIADNDNIIGNTERDRNNPKYLRRKKIESFLGSDHFFDRHIEIENLIPYRVWKKTGENLLKNKLKKEIKLKDQGPKYELKFNRDLKNKKIGILLKAYIIEKQENQNPQYFLKDNVQCLGFSKKEIMECIIQVIDEENLKFTDFPDEAQDLIKSLESFIAGANKQ